MDPKDVDFSDFGQLSALLKRGFGKATGTTKDRLQERPAASKSNDKAPVSISEERGQDATSSQHPHLAPSQLGLLPRKELCLKQHRKVVSCLDVERSGARMVTGSHDYTVAFWDFAGMDARLQPFRYVEPVGAYPLRCLRFSPNGEWLLMGATSSTPKLFDRHGAQIREYTKGDPYLRDMRNTKGHVSALYALDWHPNDPDHFLSAGQDGTIRIWNIGYRRENDHVIVIKGPPPRPSVTQARYSPDGSLIAAAATDGTVKMYSSKGPWVHPTCEIVGVHGAGAQATGLCYDPSGRLLAIRTSDDRLALWDVRRIERPLGSINGLVNLYEETACIFSPDSNMVLTGTSVRAASAQSSQLLLYDTLTLAPIHALEVAGTSVVSLAWHPKLNQIFCGLADGSINVLYDPERSHRGLLLPLQKEPTTTTSSTSISTSASTSSASASYISAATGAIQTPHALPLFRTNEGRSLKRIRIKARQDPVKSHRPELPIEGAGRGGRLGSSVTQSIMKTMMKDTLRDEDPREALLRYAEIAEKDPRFIIPAYRDTQPKPILDSGLLVKEEESERKRQEEEHSMAILTKKIGSQERKP